MRNDVLKFWDVLNCVKTIFFQIHTKFNQFEKLSVEIEARPYDQMKEMTL